MRPICYMKCCGYCVDIYNVNRVSNHFRINDYYITPSLLAKVEAWMISNNIRKIDSKELMDKLIELGYIRKYETI